MKMLKNSLLLNELFITKQRYCRIALVVVQYDTLRKSL